MRSRILSLLILMLILALTIQCAKEVDVEAEKVAILKANAGYLEACKSKDIDKIMSIFTENALWASSSLIDKEGIKKWYTEFLANNWNFDWKVEQVEVASSGDLAYTLCLVENQRVVDGDTVRTMKGGFIYIWKKQSDESWKIAAL